MTSVTSLTVELQPKRLELLHELLPTASVMALLVNPSDRALAQSQAREVLSAAHERGMELHILNASSERDFDAVFADLKRLRVGGLVISTDPFFTSRRDQIVALAARQAIPATYDWREFVVAGGLMSYGSDLVDGYRQAGVYTGKILKGDKPADLPVRQVVKLELIINLNTAKALGLTIPPILLARADEVIE